ncbi:zinc dependent phospholipase C family protein [Clostridiaceae bacterium 35-E11]
MIKLKIIENVYGNFLRASFAVINPFKKAVIQTQCKVHLFINMHALEILKKDGYIIEGHFFSNNIMKMNEGAVWADQDFKSSQHFYDPYTKKGLYGRKNAYQLGEEYYIKAIKFWKKGELDIALFYFGAAVHIVQDMTIPQHANVRLLDNHRQYETFVKRTYKYAHDFKVNQGVIVLDSIGEYIVHNTKIAKKIYKKFKRIKKDEERYYRVTKCSLPLAERTTAGCMIMFYNDIFEKRLH